MRRPKTWVLALLFCCLSPGISPGADVDDIAMPAAAIYGYGTDIEDSIQASLQLAPRLELSLTPSVSFEASMRLRVDGEQKLEPGPANVDTYAALSRPLELGEAGTVEVRDFHLLLRSHNGVTRIGKQQIVWGRLDGIKVLDLLNPQDFREFILNDLGASRIGLWSAYLDYSLGGWRGELAIIPDGSGHAIPQAGAWFELTAPRFRYGAGADEPRPIVVTQRPGHGIDDTAVGLRVSHRLDAFELSVVAYTGIDPEPLGRIVTVAGRRMLERYRKRREAFGFSAETAIGPTVIRAEYALQPDRVFNTRDAAGLAAIALEQHRGVLALDVTGPLDVIINVQYLVDAVRDAPDTLVRPSADRLATLALKRRFAYDRLDLDLRWYHSFTDDDDMFALGVEYTLAENTSVRFGLETFSGVAEGLFGQFAGRDRVTIGVEHTF